jgi:hypothetical protein
LDAFTTKKPPEGASGGDRSKPTEHVTQHVRTEQPDDAQIELLQFHDNARSIDAAARLS